MTITHAPAPQRTRPAITSGTLIALALLSATAPLATDFYLPAFPAMVEDLATSTTGVQLSLTAFLIGAGVGQVLFGPLSDRIGRLRPLVVGMAIYLVAGVVAAIAPTVTLLVVARLIQGVSGASGMVIGRAMVSDLAHGREAASAFSLMMLVSGIAPVAAPILGSLLAEPLGWRGLLWIVAAMGALALAVSLLVVRESLPPEVRARQRIDTDRPKVASLFQRRFAGNALAFAFAFATMMAYISASPFVFQDLIGMSQWQYGLAFGVNALALAVTGGISARLTRRRDPAAVARVGLLANLTAVAAMLAIVASGAPTVWLLAPILVAVAALGFVLGNTTALALNDVAKAAGLGSAALGLLQFSLSGVVAPLVGLDGNATAMPLAVTMLACSVIANAAFLFAGQK
jgi:MFS transporter, DHA1 family, multidrug resistance protein